ncbi:MAG: ribosome small subunit-dependent GTPase A [Clostridia bacterium]|nr:ribosome small subunit-dependent GTPase A [Clostridia bacterium]
MIEVKQAYVASVSRTDWKLIDKKTNLVFNATLNNSYQSEDLPIVGDRVDYITDEWGNNFILKINDRKNIIKRFSKNNDKPLVANVDVVFVVSSFNKDFELEKMERLALLGLAGKAKVAFILTKKDKCKNTEKYISELRQTFPEEKIYSVNSKDKLNASEIFESWETGQTAVFLGSSGVGKSSLVNSLCDKEILKTAEVRESDDRGRHTTTARYLIPIKGNRWVIDTPGIRSIQSASDTNPVDVFEEIKELEKQCKYRDCGHTKEDGCAVLNALNMGTLQKDIYERFIKLKSGLNAGSKQSKMEERKQSKLLKTKRIQSKNKKVVNKKHR